MASLFERYTAGEHAPVLGELAARGAEVWAPPLRADAWRVAQEVVDRAYWNLSLLARRLTEMGYEFANPTAVLVLASPGDRARVADVEATQGRLPMILEAWYAKIGSVDFSQAEEQLAGSRSAEGGVAGLGMNAVLVIHSPAAALRLQKELQREESETVEEGASHGSFFPIGGCASNCEPRGGNLPSSRFDDVIYNDGGGDITFVDELRSAFRWGGFPFWRHKVERPKKIQGTGPEPDFARLLPKLTEGLVAI